MLLLWLYCCIYRRGTSVDHTSTLSPLLTFLLLTSSIPSAGGVYHWASVTPGPRYGRVLGFFTGSLNFFGWIFDLASIVSIPSNVAVQMYAVFHPDLIIKPWHVYVAFILITWSCCALVVFGNRLLPVLNQIGLFLVIVGGLVTIIVVAAMPKVHASNSAVWGDFSQNNAAGWSNGVTFLTGVLNGAFTIGTPDAVTHMSEELPNPARDMPRAVGAQIILGTLSMFPPSSSQCIALMGLSVFPLRHRYPLRRQRPNSGRRQQRILSARSRLLPSYWQQGCHFRPAFNSLSLHHDLCARHFSHGMPPTL